MRFKRIEEVHKQRWKKRNCDKNITEQWWLMSGRYNNVNIHLVKPYTGLVIEVRKTMRVVASASWTSAMRWRRRWWHSCYLCPTHFKKAAHSMTGFTHGTVILVEHLAVYEHLSYVDAKFVSRFVPEIEQNFFCIKLLFLTRMKQRLDSFLFYFIGVSEELQLNSINVNQFVGVANMEHVILASFWSKHRSMCFVIKRCEWITTNLRTVL